MNVFFIRNIKNICIIILIYFLFGSQNCYAQDETEYINEPLKLIGMVQRGGNIGYLSIGAGVSIIDDQFQIAVQYGKTETPNYGQTVHTIGFRNTWVPFRWEVVDKNKLAPYLGFTYAFSGEAPAPFLMLLGADWEFHLAESSVVDRISLYVETSVNVIWAEYVAKNESIPSNTMFNFAYGAKIAFDFSQETK